MMLPILISVSVAPVSYFFCASAPLLITASKAMAAEKAPNRNWIAGMWVSLVSVERVLFLIGSASWPLPAFNTFSRSPSRKSPLRRGRRGPSLVEQGWEPLRTSVAEFAADDVPEQFPFLALEPHHLKLLDRGEVGRRGADRHAGQQGVGRKLLQARRLLHDVFAGQIIAAHLKNLHHGLGYAVAVHDGAIELVGFGIILLQERIEFLHAGIVVPLGVRTVLGVSGRENALRILKARRLDHGADGGRNVGDDMQRLPFDLGELLDRLRREFRGGDADEDVGAGGLQLDDVVVDRRLRGLVTFFSNDHRRLGAQPVLQALEVIFPEIVILVHDGDLGARFLFQQVLRVNARFALIAGLPAHGPGKVLGIVPLGGAGGDEQLRHLLCVQIFLDRRVRRRAKGIEDQQYFVALHQLAYLLYGLRRAVAVVIADEIDLAAVDAALGVDLLEVGLLGLADHAVSGGRAAIGHDVADLDFGVGRTGVVFLLGECTATHGSDGDLPCAVRHQEDDKEQKYAEHGAGEAL